MKITEVVELFVKLRDARSELKRKFDEEDGQLRDQMDKIEAALLGHMQESGLTSMSTPAGTAFISTKTGASVADKESFLAYVRDNDEWPLMEVRVSKTAVQQYRELNQAIPPGINWYEERVVSIRRK